MDGAWVSAAAVAAPDDVTELNVLPVLLEEQDSDAQAGIGGYFVVRRDSVEEVGSRVLPLVHCCPGGH